MENKSIAYTFGSQQKYPKTDNNYLGILSVQICNITDKDYNQSKKWSETFTFITIRFERTKGHICFNGRADFLSAIEHSTSGYFIKIFFCFYGTSSVDSF